MNTAQVSACQPGICVKNVSQLQHLRSKTCVLPMRISHLSLTLRAKQSLGLKCLPMSKFQKPLHVCSAGGKGMMGNNDEDSPWTSLGKAIEKLKGQSIEDVLRKQLEKGEYYDNGGGGAKPPGGGGGSGGSPDGSGESEDESFAESWDENLQVFLATFGFIFLYIYILTGEELTKLARDYIKYLLGGNQSVRLKNAMLEWGQFYRSVTEKEVEDDPYWLEKTILDTPTWWYDPEDLYEAIRNYLDSNSGEVVRNYSESNSDEAVRNYSQSNSDEFFRNYSKSNSDEFFKNYSESNSDE